MALAATNNVFSETALIPRLQTTHRSTARSEPIIYDNVLATSKKGNAARVRSDREGQSQSLDPNAH